MIREEGLLMKNNQIVISTIFSVFIMVCTPVIATLLQEENQISNNIILNETKIDLKELLFQTIVDLANNKEIQRIIMKSQIDGEGFFNPDVKFSVFKPQVLTKNNLKHMYLIGLMISKTFSKSRIHSMLEQYQVSNQIVQKEITAVIEKDATLKGEIKQLSNLNCECENNSGITTWPFPVICTILYVIGIFSFFLQWFLHIGSHIATFIGNLGVILHCTWAM